MRAARHRGANNSVGRLTRIGGAA